MLLLDDAVTAPFSGLLWVFREIHKAVKEEMAREAEALTGRLSDLYRRLETGEVTEAQFAVQEAEILDRLDLLQNSDEAEEDDEADDDTEEDGD
jgi:hypothetical protein